MSADLRAIAVSAGLSLTGALAFLLATLLTGDYSWAAHVGGSTWVFMLGMIIALPTVMPLLASRERRA
jgi:hypothetical protein